MADLIDIADPGERVPRYSRRPFPAYRYVPGLHPHPTRDPAGHSYQPRPTLNRHALWSPEDWRALAACRPWQCAATQRGADHRNDAGRRPLDDWLYGIDLFNRFYFWEAHEAWEGLWAAVARQTPPSLMLQGLIQIAAALLKTHLRALAGARLLSTEGVEKLRRAATGEPRLLGLDLGAAADRFARYFAPVRDGQLPLIGPEVPLLRLEQLG